MVFKELTRLLMIPATIASGQALASDSLDCQGSLMLEHKSTPRVDMGFNPFNGPATAGQIGATCGKLYFGLFGIRDNHEGTPDEFDLIFKLTTTSDSGKTTYEAGGEWWKFPKDGSSNYVFVGNVAHSGKYFDWSFNLKQILDGQGTQAFFQVGKTIDWGKYRGISFSSTISAASAFTRRFFGTDGKPMNNYITGSLDASYRGQNASFYVHSHDGKGEFNNQKKVGLKLNLSTENIGKKLATLFRYRRY